jgi:hypothetical protein
MRQFATKNGTNEFALDVYFRYSKSKFVKEWELLRQAYMEFYSYNRAIEVGTRIQNLNHAVRRFTKVYSEQMPNFCRFLQANYAFMDNGALNDLIGQNQLEVEKVLKLEQKESKKLDIIAAKNRYFV